MASILKARRICGRSIILREIEVEDAKFVFDLRTNASKSKFISATSGLVEDQVRWIENYKISKNQAYFIICDSQGSRLGCVRVYDADGRSYCWGSWLMVSGLIPLVAIETALLIYAYGKFLGFTEARIDVRRENESVWRFHEKFCGASLIGQDDLDRRYILCEKQIDALLTKHAAFVTSPLQVDFA